MCFTSRRIPNTPSGREAIEELEDRLSQTAKTVLGLAIAAGIVLSVLIKRRVALLARGWKRGSRSRSGQRFAPPPSAADCPPRDREPLFTSACLGGQPTAARRVEGLGGKVIPTTVPKPLKPGRAVLAPENNRGWVPPSLQDFRVSYVCLHLNPTYGPKR